MRIKKSLRAPILTVVVASQLMCGSGYHASASSLKYTTSAAHCINNDSVSVDYKLSEEEQSAVIKKLKDSYLAEYDADESDKYVNYNTDRSVKLSKNDDGVEQSILANAALAKSYLVENNLLERKAVLKYDSTEKRYVATTYEDATNQWNKLFDEQYESHLGKVTRSTSASDAIKNFNAYVDTVSKKTALTLLVGIGEISSSGLERVETNLENRKVQFKKNLKGVKDSGIVYTKYRAAMKSLVKYAKGFKPPAIADDFDNVTKSELLPLLCKATFGVQSSRPVVFKNSSVRNGVSYSTSTPEYWEKGRVVKFLANYWNNAELTGDADFSGGDYYYYVTGNVAELYLKTLLDKGLIYEDELGSSNAAKSFKSEYKSFKTKQPVWYTGKGLSLSSTQNALGYSISLKNDSVQHRGADYFKQEDLSAMEVYQYVEDMLRATEKEITKKEADIITYKFGLNYLAQYSGEQRKTLEFLIAKGVLNFEDVTEFQNLNDSMSYARLYQLLYRVHNKKARFDFSKVTLTDAESFWQNKGYAENDISVSSLPYDFIMKEGTPKEVKDNEVEKTAWGAMDDNTVLAAQSTYTITFKLSCDLGWEYNFKSIKSMFTSQDYPKEISDITKKVIDYNGKKFEAYVVKVTVQAGTAAGALKYARDRLTVKSSSSDKIQTVTKVKGTTYDNNYLEEYTMISQSALKKSFSDISVLEDKVLINTKTNAQAILLPDLGYALVGNTIIKTDGFIMEKTNDEVYYNLKVIISLLNDTFLKKIGVSATLFKCSANLKTYLAKVTNEYDREESVTCCNVKATAGMAANSGAENYAEGDAASFYRVNDLTNGVNTLARKFRVSWGGDKDWTIDLQLVVDWNFAIPSVDDFADSADIAKEFATNKQLSQKDVVKCIYTRPKKSKILQTWWDSNYVANNALVNFMFGTKNNVEYVTSGYLTPSITILGPNSSVFTKHTVGWTNRLFKGFQIVGYDKKTDSDTNTLASYFGGGTDWSTWYSRFYSPSMAFNGVSDKFTDDEYNTLCRLAQRFRSYRTIAGVSTSKYGGCSFGMSYLLTNAGVLYRNVDDDDRIKYKMKKSNVTEIKVGTRTASAGRAVENETVVYGAKKKRQMLYRGIKDGYYRLTPVSMTKVSNRDSKFYNGGYFAINTGTGGVTFTIDRGCDEATYTSGVYKARPPLAEDQFMSWQDSYSTWAEYFLGESISPPTEKDDSNVYKFNKTCHDLAIKLGASYSWNDVFYNHKTGTAKKMENGDKSDWLAALRDCIYAPGVKKELGHFNGGVVKQGDLRPGLTLDNGTTEIYGSPLDSKKKNRVVVGSRTGHNPKLMVNNLAPEYRPCYYKEKNSKKYVESKYVVYGVPTFLLPTTDWHLTMNNNGTAKIEKGGNVPAICFSNYYYSGIMKTVQESIISHYVKTTDLGNISSGNQVTIAGLRFYRDADDKQNDKNGIWLTSAHLNIRGTRDSLVKAAKKWGNTKKSQEPYKTEVKNIFKDTLIRCDNVAYPLTNYILDKSKIGAKSGIQIAGLKKTDENKKYGVVYCKNNKVFGYKNGSSESIKKSTRKYQYVRIRIKLNKKLKVRPISDDGNFYTLTSTTVSGNIGLEDDALMFYDELLSYGDDQYADISVYSSRFNPSAAFTEARNRFMKLYKSAMTGDIQTLVLAIICSIAIYLAVMNWIAYLVLHYGVMHNLFNLLESGPGNSSGTGFDVIKFFTFGMYTLRDDPPFVRIFIISLLCAIVAAITVSF